MGHSPSPTGSHHPPITEELGMVIPSCSAPRVCSCVGAHEGRGCAWGRCVAPGAAASGTCSPGPGRLPPAAHSARHDLWGLSGGTAGHTPGFAGEEELCHHRCGCGVDARWMWGGCGAAVGSAGGAPAWAGG